MNNKRSTTIPHTMSASYDVDVTKLELVEGSSCQVCKSILDVGEVECTGMHGVCVTCYFEVVGKE